MYRRSTIDDRSHRECAADAHGIPFLTFKHTSAHRAGIPFLTRCRPARMIRNQICRLHRSSGRTFTLFGRRELLQRAIIKPNARRVNKIFRCRDNIAGWILSTLKTVICMLRQCYLALPRVGAESIISTSKKELNLLPTWNSMGLLGLSRTLACFPIKFGHRGRVTSASVRKEKKKRILAEERD